MTRRILNLSGIAADENSLFFCKRFDNSKGLDLISSQLLFFQAILSKYFFTQSHVVFPGQLQGDEANISRDVNIEKN